MGEVEIVDFGIEDQPRELKISSPLFTDKRDKLILGLVEYLEWLANVALVPKKDDKFKNTGATYQRTATILFHDMMHRDVEVYIDDMIMKSRDKANHLTTLRRFFERIWKFRLRHPKMCTFGVTSRKLLGHIVSERGIEADPDKIRAIVDMPALRIKCGIKDSLGRL
ncbi:hypothetical protein AAG906_004496 [Vitis piasezkii]